MRTYLFYDLETTGLNRSFDQIVQFAAIRTDERLNQIEEHNFFVKLMPDIFYSPSALLKTNITIDKLQGTINEYEAIKNIHALINTPETISIGYNNLRFDDLFLRFGFYRNLFSPYTHQFKDGCIRMDMLPISIFYFLFNNPIIKWPLINDSYSFKLEHLNSSNNFIEGASHDALNDVKVTLELARALSSNIDMWNNSQCYFNKQFDSKKTFNSLTSTEGIFEDKNMGIAVDISFGSSNNFIAPLYYIGESSVYTNQQLFLRLDEEEFSNAEPEQLNSVKKLYKKKFGEPFFFINKSKTITNFISQDRMALIERNLIWIQNNITNLKQITRGAVDFQYEKIDNVDVQSKLYSMDFNAFDSYNHIFRKFHESDVAGKFELLDLITNKDFKTLAIRLLSRNYYEQLPSTYKKAFDEYLTQSRLESHSKSFDYAGKNKYSYNELMGDIEILLTDPETNDTQKDMLLSMKHYYQSTF